jgi:hypothetical protein
MAYDEGLAERLRSILEEQRGLSEPMKGFVFVAQEGLDSERQLEWWVGLGISTARASVPIVARKPG